MASASSSTAVPKVKSSAKAKAKAPPPALTPEEVDTSDDSDSSEADSEGDLENITPRRQQVTTTDAAPRPGKSLPKFQPPNGFFEIKVSTDFASSPFEWDALASKPGVEVWAIRAPRDLKPSRLSALTVSVPRSKEGKVSGSLKTKHQSFKLTPAGSSKPTHTVVDDEGRQPTAGPGLVDAMAMDVDGNEPEELRVEGGEEMNGMKLFVPRLKQGGKYYVAPVPITRHLLLTPELSVAEPEPSSRAQPLPSFLSTSVPDSTETPSSIHPESALPSKRPQPTHLFKFRNQAFGFHTPGPNAPHTDSIQTDEPAKKEKKRRSEAKADSPVKKKAKKVKA
ncbi:hypothetical protein CI109_106973 [Kwoniella shandongensis]|uniref:Uncharacterized protein n=1 Tax=Kwoniella shandongensis TaxID=1734106 RepID=A0A5M6CAY4_9TREE|nr:uncharacterized protein CI109_000773 [Kwoniella shandongensis]KAA5530595.1 hypothetical protein CI109_000773 [Kwoniella shandongensis]